MDNAIDSQLTLIMERYKLRSKKELSQDLVPASPAVQTCSYSMPMQHMLVLPVTQFGTGTPPEEQSESLLPAEASHPAAGPTDLDTDKDQTSTGLPTDSTSQGPEKADPFLLPATTAAGLVTGTWMTSKGQGHLDTRPPHQNKPRIQHLILLLPNSVCTKWV